MGAGLSSWLVALRPDGSVCLLLRRLRTLKAPCFSEFGVAGQRSSS